MFLIGEQRRRPLAVRQVRVAHAMSLQAHHLAAVDKIRHKM
jgi:hypothetical protein